MATDWNALADAGVGWPGALGRDGVADLSDVDVFNWSGFVDSLSDAFRGTP